MIALAVLALLAQTGDSGGFVDPTTPPLLEAPPQVEDQKPNPANELQQQQVTPPPVQQQQTPPPTVQHDREPPESQEHFEGPALGPTASLYLGLPPLGPGASSYYLGFRFGARLWPSGEKPLAVSFQLGVEGASSAALTGTLRLELTGRAGFPYVVPFVHAGLTGTGFATVPNGATQTQEYGVRVGLSLGWCLWALRDDAPSEGNWMSGWNWSGGGGDGALIALLVVLLATTPDLQLVYEHRENSPLGRIDSGRVEVGIGF